MDSTRQLRVSRLMQKELGNLFSNELKEYTAHSLVTVTETRVTPDLSVCKVFVSIFPPDKRKPVFELINQHNKEIRHALAGKVGKEVRVIPELIFLLDDTLDQSEKIEQLLKNL
jgi:ribosome-binding factor A